jgi:L-amino acid N-acyltransferase YncA
VRPPGDGQAAKDDTVTNGPGSTGASGGDCADQRFEIEIREAHGADWPAIWPFFHTIVAAGETFAYDPAMDEPAGRQIWMQAPPGRTVVAAGRDGTVLGSAKMGPNQQGPGAHVATASFMVDPARSGRGIGRALGEYAVAWARAAGFRGMQFNAVASSNTRAVALWRALGFEVIGTIPGGFRHPSLGYVGLHVMYRALDA